MCQGHIFYVFLIRKGNCEMQSLDETFTGWVRCICERLPIRPKRRLSSYSPDEYLSLVRNCNYYLGWHRATLKHSWKVLILCAITLNIQPLFIIFPLSADQLATRWCNGVHLLCDLIISGSSQNKFCLHVCLCRNKVF